MKLSSLTLAIAAACAAPTAFSQSFVPGNLIVSRTSYAGTASTVTVGQALPGGGTAIANGSFPNVFKNESADPSFGITSPIYLDQLTTTGALVSSLTINSSLITSSFASKSELALNISSDGSSVAFMGYAAPKNTLDVSNSNTSAVFDPTNPVASTYARAIGQVDLATGNLQVINVNAYSGNNGRAAALVNGNYYMVGNAGNGSGNGTTLSQLSDNTGVQRIAVSGSGNTTAVGAVQGTFGSSTGYQRGFSLAQLSDPANPGHAYAADKSGKDDNFRGLTVFNNTLYVSKGSGSNGVNTVYQVGAAGALANGAVLSNAPITILPGFNTLSEKVAESTTNPVATPHPFGMWFGDATTLFVADEGDGVRLGVAGKVTTFAGLQEWKLAGGVWNLAQTFQSGLVGQLSTPAGLGWEVEEDGLRNLTGRVNADGSFTLYATTSTVSDELTHDLGADPNEIVSITVGASSTASNDSFLVLDTAAAGDRFGGVAFAAPVPEPETYGLMLGGLSLLAWRKRRQAAGLRADRASTGRASSPHKAVAFALMSGAALLGCSSAALAQNTTPVVLTFSTVGDSRQDPVTFDKASVGNTLTGQDSIWLQNTKAFARILRTIQSQKSAMLFFNGDMVHGYGWAGLGYTSNAAGSTIVGPVAPASVSDVVNGDLLKFYQQYAFWRGLVAPVMETGTYVFPVPGNHETECKACGKAAKVENENAWGANMGDLVIDTTRFTGILGSAPLNVSYGPAASVGPDGLTTDQSKLSYSFDFKGMHFAIINTDPVGSESHAPTQWLAADLAAAATRGVRRQFVFGHKPAYTYAYLANGPTAAAGLDAAPGTIAARDAFWNVIETNGATYFCGHEHTYNVSQPLGGAYQVIVGGGGSPFDPKATDATKNPATDRDYSWVTARIHQDGGVDLLGYGFDAGFGPTQLLQQFYLP